MNTEPAWFGRPAKVLVRSGLTQRFYEAGVLNDTSLALDTNFPHWPEVIIGK